MIDFDAKQPAEAYLIPFDFSGELGSATIASFSIVATDLLDSSPATSVFDSTLSTISTSFVMVWVKSGTDEHDYHIVCNIEASDGSNYELEGILPVREIVASSSMLVIEDGSLSTPSANSYITVAEVDTYCKQMGYSGWFVLSNTDKETAILRAMIYVDSLDFKGEKTYWDNPLAWPRIGVYGDQPTVFNYPENYEYWSEYPIDAIPKVLKRGLSEAAYLESITPGTLTTTQTTNIKREKVDVLEVEYFSPTPAETVQTKILALMKDILEPNGGHFATVLRT